MSHKRYTDEQRDQISKSAIGKTIKSMDWCPYGKHWTLTFTDETEMSIFLVAELGPGEL